LRHAFRTALLINGVDWFGFSGMTSISHTDADLADTVNAFDRAISMLEDEK
jgi:glutamate-1-semialdehyde 2,1-aminomutase